MLWSRDEESRLRSVEPESIIHHCWERIMGKLLDVSFGINVFIKWGGTLTSRCGTVVWT